MSKPDVVDWVAAITKGAVGAIPVVGPIVAEVAGNLIPRQRLDRIAVFLRDLDYRLQQAQQTQEKLRERLENPQALDLLEEGLHQAARAVSEERKQQIASIVANGLSSESLEFIESKHLLSILNEINDIELLVLASYSFAFETQNDNSDEWRRATRFEHPTLAAPQSEKDRYALQQSYRNHLTRLGLLQSRFPSRPGIRIGDSPRDNVPEVPQFDYKTGMMESVGVDITPLGELLLRKVGLVTEVSAGEEWE